jgi:hypothetical protein
MLPNLDLTENKSCEDCALSGLPFTLKVCGNANINGDLYLGNQTSYVMYYGSANTGLRTNGNFLADGNIYWGSSGNWLSAYLNQAVLSSSSPTFSNVYISSLGWITNIFNQPVTSSSGPTFADLTVDGGGTSISATNGNIYAAGALEASGDVYCGSCGGWLHSNLGISDRRLKKDVEPVTGGLETVMKLKPVTFYWKRQDRNHPLVVDGSARSRGRDATTCRPSRRKSAPRPLPGHGLPFPAGDDLPLSRQVKRTILP